MGEELVSTEAAVRVVTKAPGREIGVTPVAATVPTPWASAENARRDGRRADRVDTPRSTHRPTASTASKPCARVPLPVSPAAVF